MSEKWSEARQKLKKDLSEESPRGEWWTHEPYSKIVRDANQAHLWLYHCAYNKTTGRWHIPMKKNGILNTFLHDQIRKRESGITYCLNVGFKERRGGFFDSAWVDKRPDFWLVCDEYLECGEMTDNAPPPISRAHCQEDTRILGWSHEKGNYALIPFDGYEGKSGQGQKILSVAKNA